MKSKKILVLVLVFVVIMIPVKSYATEENNDNDTLEVIMIDKQSIKDLEENKTNTIDDENLNKTFEYITEQSRHYTTDYKELTTQLNVSPTKQWTLTFNKPINIKSAKKSIKVIDKNGKEIDVTIEKGKTNKEIIVKAPKGGYIPGETYALMIIRREGLFKLKKEIVMKFVISNKSSSYNNQYTDAELSVINKNIKGLPPQLEGLGYELNRFYYDTLVEPKESDWLDKSDEVPARLYEYPCRTVAKMLYCSNNYYFTTYKEEQWKIERMIGRIEQAKEYMECKYNYNYKKQKEHKKEVLKNMKSGQRLGGDSTTQKYIYPDDWYESYLNTFKNKKIVSEAEFITDKSLFYMNGARYMIRGTLKIKYTDGTSKEFLDRYGLVKNVWYSIDKEVTIANAVEDREKMYRWLCKADAVLYEYNLSDLMAE